MKKLFLVFFVLMLCLNCFALTLNADKVSYTKGDKIKINGTCNESELITLSALNEERIIFEDKVVCINNGFEFEVEIDYTFPKGDWKLIATSEAGSKKTEEVSVSETKESQFLLITFLSPSTENRFRTEDIKVSVRISDSGNLVKDANVFFWGIEGNKIKLKGKENGVYSADYEIPFNAKEDEWKLTVTTEKIQEGKRIGGEHLIKIPIRKPKIEVTFLKPVERNFSVGDNSTFIVTTKYFNGKKLINPKAELILNGKPVKMRLNSKGEFEGSHVFREADQGIKTAEVIVSDEAGNTGEKNIELIIGGYLTWLLINNIIYILIGIVVILLVITLVYHFVKKSGTAKSLVQEKQALENELKQLQIDYFKKGIISKDKYKTELMNIEAGLNEVEKKLKIK